MRVVDAGGGPVAGAIVTVEAGTAPTPEIGIVTGGDGCCRLALPPGRFCVAAFAGGRSGRVEVEIEGGGGVDAVELRLDDR